MRRSSSHAEVNEVFWRSRNFAVAIALAHSAARATPYAFASNQITGLTITNADGSALSSVSSATTNVVDGAQFDGSPAAVFQGAGVVGVGQAEALGRSRGGFGTKIVGVCDTPPVGWSISF